VRILALFTFVGRFTKLELGLGFDAKNIAGTRIAVRVDPRAVEADPETPAFLRSLVDVDWLEAERFPQIEYVSSGVEVISSQDLRIQGDLTLHGVTRPLLFEAHYESRDARDPQASASLVARGKVRRSEFGISPAAAGPLGRLAIADEIELCLELGGPGLGFPRAT
jgi:polyisoprenoid-binding protein YceI